MGPWFGEIIRRYPKSDFYVGLPFWGYLAVAIVVWRAFPAKGTPKAILLLACNVLIRRSLFSEPDGSFDPKISKKRRR